MTELATPDLLDKAESILTHVGVKGMRWGVRRANKKTRKLISPNDHKRLKGLSDEQLLLVVNRMALEKRYVELKRGTRSEGAEFALELLKGAGTTAVNQTMKSLLAPSLKQALENSATKAVSKSKADKAAIEKANEASLAIAKKRLEKSSS